MTQPSVWEQYLLEMINRARLNPTAEANLHGISDLNQGLDPGTISDDPKQPLAFNSFLIDSSRTHSNWMLDNNIFSHYIVDENDIDPETNEPRIISTPTQRMTEAGYQFTGSWGTGENIAYKPTFGTVDRTLFTEILHEGLFQSKYHRKNILDSGFREIGLATTTGEFTHSNGNTYNTLMITENFAKSGSDRFLTGVAFDDLITPDDFYTVGEGLGGIDVTAVNVSSNLSYMTETMTAGGYQMALPSGSYEVSFSDNGEAIGGTREVTIGTENIKLDLDTSDLAPVLMSEQMGEIGMVSNLNHNNQTIELNNTYTNPVIFTMPLSFNGAQPAIARITDIQSDSFSVYAQEPEYLDGKHAKESFSYLVLEAGTWELEDGTILEVGTLDTNKITTSGWENIDFASDFNETPVILSKVQTDKGSQFVNTRQRNGNLDGFQLSMEEEEALKNSGHNSETVGWLAMESSSGSSWDGFAYEAASTSYDIDHTWDTISFGQTFAEAPNLLASMSSYRGSDSAWLRYDNLGASQVQIKVEEDRSLDTEIGHIKESVDFLAIAGSGDLSAIAI